MPGADQGAGAALAVVLAGAVHSGFAAGQLRQREVELVVWPRQAQGLGFPHGRGQVVQVGAEVGVVAKPLHVAHEVEENFSPRGTTAAPCSVNFQRFSPKGLRARCGRTCRWAATATG